MFKTLQKHISIIIWSSSDTWEQSFWFTVHKIGIKLKGPLKTFIFYRFYFISIRKWTMFFQGLCFRIFLIVSFKLLFHLVAILAFSPTLYWLKVLICSIDTFQLVMLSTHGVELFLQFFKIIYGAAKTANTHLFSSIFRLFCITHCFWKKYLGFINLWR